MSYKQLSEGERYQIYAMISVGCSQQKIAEHLRRSPSTISRELRRNRGLRGYRSIRAQRLSDNRRASAYKAIKITDEVSTWIDRLVRQKLSPQQVVDYLLRHKNLSLHHETIYQFIYADKAEGGSSICSVKHSDNYLQAFSRRSRRVIYYI